MKEPLITFTVQFTKAEFVKELETSEGFRDMVANMFLDGEADVDLVPKPEEKPKFDVHENCDSSTLVAVGYEFLTNSLFVRFRNTGKIYRYSNVPLWKWEKFIEAGISGFNYNDMFRGQYPSTQVDVEDYHPFHKFPF